MSTVPIRPLGRPVPESLAPARLSLHHAVQLPAALGALIEPRPAYAHLALEWLASSGAFASATWRGSRAALRAADLTLIVADERGAAQGELALHGRTRNEALEWLAETLGARAGERPELVLPAHELPEHAVLAGEPFDARATGMADALAELARWYALASRELSALRARLPHPSAVQVWPHHFDVAVLAALDPGLGEDEARTVGTGFSPGDDSFAEPYWYVTPWPYPDARAELAALPSGGEWQREGWTGAVLRASVLLEGGAHDVELRSRSFLEAAVAASLAVHGA
jgi:hypothetical protein